MINVYKFSGPHTKLDGTPYSIKTINEADKSKYLIDGWVNKLESVKYIEYASFEEVKETKKEKQTKTVKTKPSTKD